jgi:hypothetical protein
LDVQKVIFASLNFWKQVPSIRPTSAPSSTGTVFDHGGRNSVIALGFSTHASYILPPMTDKYPDISDILRRKAEGRRSRAARTFAEKVADIEALRERLAPMKQRRAQTQHERNASKSEF